MIIRPITPAPCPIETDRSLAALTTWRIGGPADFYAEPETPEQLAACYEFAAERDIPVLGLGGASNMLVHDDGFRGLVVRYTDREETRTITGTQLELRIGARTLLARLARQIARDGWSGLEWAEGIPGTLGGAIVGNAGAFGGEMASVVTEVEVFDPSRCEVHTYANDECQFAYRSSRFKTGGAATGYVLGATLRLRKEAAESILARMDAIRVRRKSNSPTGLSCGSVFKNPPGDFAGRIVETLGLKGTSIGGAEISSVHGNYIVNRERATAKDVCALIDLVRSRARDELGLELELEVRLVGFGDA